MPIDKKELLAALKDPSIRQWLTSLAIQNATVTGIGRIPGQGPAQNDNYVYPDACDANFPYKFKYLIPQNFQRIISARLSFSLDPYRTYSSLTLSSTGGQSQTHTHPSATHNHPHPHTWHIALTAQAASMSSDGLGAVLDNARGPSDVSTTTDSTNTTPGATGGASVDHTHTVSGTSVLGIAEDVAPSNPGITVAVDGTDVTAKLGGPFNGDMVELDVSQTLQLAPKKFHTLALQPNQRVRITGILRISYLVDSRLAQ